MTALISLFPLPGSTVLGKTHPLLSITRGLHRGVYLALDCAVYTIGSAVSADLILSDAGITERHMVLRFVEGRICVEALGGDVLVLGPQGRETLVPMGSGHRARLPLEIGIGNARLRLECSVPTQGPPAAVPPAWRNRQQWLFALVLMFLCVGAFAFRGEPTTPGALLIGLPTEIPPASRATRAEARLWLDQQMLAAGIKTIKLSEVEGQLIAEGSYELGQKSQWIALQQAFDKQFSQQVMLQANVTVHADIANPRVRFQAVWFGANPYAINDSGKRLYPGAALADGWILERIENNQVVLAKGEARFSLTL
ncbi:SctD/MshK family protein [Pseudomonas sp. LB1P83]